MPIISWIERQGLHRAYYILYQRGCDCVDYPLGAEPSPDFVALVTKYCIAHHVPYEQVVIGDLEEWLVTQGCTADSIRAVHWRSQSNSKK